MPAYKDAQKGTWYAAFYYQDWKGVKKKKLKRGFPTKKEALAWERTFLLQQAADLTMTLILPTSTRTYSRQSSRKWRPN